MSHELEDRLGRMGDRVPEPSPGATARARAAALDALSADGRRGLAVGRRLRRPLGWALSAAGAVALAALLGLMLVAAPDEPGPAPAAADLRPDIAAVGAVAECEEPLLRVPCVAGATAARRADPALRDAPWLHRSPGGGAPGLGAASPRPSLTFPAGTTYAQALDALYVSVTLTGRLPRGTSLGGPLPDGVVLVEPRDPADGVTIDLRAPFGWEPAADRPVAGPSLVSVDASSSTGRTVWPVGTLLAVPELPACMVRRAPEGPPATCAAADRPVLREVADIPVLPEVAWQVRTESLVVIRPEARRPADLGALALPAIAPSARALDPASLRGRVVVVAFLASWCEPCEPAARAIDALAGRYRGAGDVTVVGVAVDDADARARAAHDAAGLGFPLLADRRDRARRAFGVSGLPDAVIIDARGRIAARVAGALPVTGVLEQAITGLRAEAAGSP